MELMTGTVEINGLRLFARHGVYERERIDGNTFELTVRLVYPMSRAMVNDDLAGTLDYAEAVELIRQVMLTPSSLLEHVAWRIREALISRWPLIKGGYIRIAKLTPPIPARLQDVAISINW